MEIAIKILITLLFTLSCLGIIIEGINKQLSKETNKQKELNKQIWGLLQNEKQKTDTLYKIIFHIRQQLSLLKLKECPEEEFKNIPFEIIEWIDALERINNGDIDDNKE